MEIFFPARRRRRLIGRGNERSEERTTSAWLDFVSRGSLVLVARTAALCPVLAVDQEVVEQLVAVAARRRRRYSAREIAQVKASTTCL